MALIAEAIARPLPDTAKLLADFEIDCKDRHLTDETIGRYKSPLKLFFSFLSQRNQTILDVDKHVLKDFIHFRRGQDI
jgi:site-specific recombinase XerD